LKNWDGPRHIPAISAEAKAAKENLKGSKPNIILVMTDDQGYGESFIHGAGGIGQNFPGTESNPPNNGYFDPAIKHNNTFVKTKGYCSDVFFKQSLAWIKQCHEEKKPFFAYLSTNAPHGPFIVAANYKAPYVAKGAAANGKKGENGKKGKRKDNFAAFYGMIANIDENMGVLMQKLDEWELSDNTLLIFMTDNGSSAGNYNAGMKGKKNSPYEGGSRVPLFMRLPGKIKPGTDIARLTRHYDLFPTLASIAGAKVPENHKLDGRNLLPLIENPKATWPDRDTVFHLGRWNKKGAAGRWGQGDTDPDQAKYKGFAVRNESWRLVGNALYNIDKDPGETSDVAKQHPKIAATMRKNFDAWWTDVRPLMVNANASLDTDKPFLDQYLKQEKSTGIPTWAEPKLNLGKTSAKRNSCALNTSRT
jgi:arylsulfatase